MMRSPVRATGCTWSNLDQQLFSHAQLRSQGMVLQIPIIAHGEAQHTRSTHKTAMYNELQSPYQVEVEIHARMLKVNQWQLAGQCERWHRCQELVTLPIRRIPNALKASQIPASIESAIFTRCARLIVCSHRILVIHCYNLFIC